MAGIGSAVSAWTARDRFDSISPIDEQPIANVAAGGEAEVDQAVDAAAKAFQSWQKAEPRTSAPPISTASPIVEAARRTAFRRRDPRQRLAPALRTGAASCRALR